MTTQMMINETAPFTYQQPNVLQLVAAQLEDSHAVVTLFGALHAYNASLDPHFALSDGWETILLEQFHSSVDNPDMMWLLVKDGNEVIGLMIAGVHTDSPLFRHRQWVEVQALYVADSHRGMGIAHTLLQQAYAWAEALNLPRVQLYVTATNVRAQSVYAEEGFATSQAIMRKKL
jgi:ribosomal protein S18 acetylase RimI-like enzyme